jgi:hypothetical protein
MNRMFTSDHEWLTVDGDVATVGITDYAQSQLGDVGPGTALWCNRGPSYFRKTENEHNESGSPPTPDVLRRRSEPPLRAKTGREQLQQTM